jgi:hypothetical protein
MYNHPMNAEEECIYPEEVQTLQAERIPSQESLKE